MSAEGGEEKVTFTHQRGRTGCRACKGAVTGGTVTFGNGSSVSFSVKNGQIAGINGASLSPTVGSNDKMDLMAGLGDMSDRPETKQEELFGLPDLDVSTMTAQAGKGSQNNGSGNKSSSAGSAGGGTVNNQQKLRAELAKEFNASIEEARRLGEAGDIDGYIDLVRSGGLWDFKSRTKYKNLDSIEDFGNFAFGVTGAAWADGYTGGQSNQYPDLTTNLLLRGAGAYQEFFQKYNPSDGSFYDLSPPAESNYGDQFNDQYNIYTGAQYYFKLKGGG